MPWLYPLHRKASDGNLKKEIEPALLFFTLSHYDYHTVFMVTSSVKEIL